MSVAALLLFALPAIRGSGGPAVAALEMTRLPFEFVLAEEDVSRFATAAAETSPAEGVASTLRWLPAQAGERVDLFQERPGREGWPRWKWVGARVSHDGLARFGARIHVTTIAVWRRSGSNGYRVSSPFRWPSEPREVLLTPVQARTLRGQALLGTSLGRPRWISADPHPKDDPLCEADGGGGQKWQCIAVPTAAAGAITFCGPGEDRLSAFVDASRTGDLALESTAWAAPIEVEIPAGAEATRAEPISFWISGPGGANGQIRETTAAKVAPIGGNLYWIGGPAGPETRLSAHRGSTLSGTIPAAEIATAPCGTPVSIILEKTEPLRGRVLRASGAPLARASVLLLEARPRPQAERPEGDALPPAFVASTLSNENGAWSFDGLEPRAMRIRACEATAGCAEKEASPGSADVELILSPRWRFVGRLVSRSGVPQPHVHLRFAPTLDQYAGARDRLLTLPPETDAESDSEGRFEIAPPSAGAYYLEARSLGVGTARKQVEITELSPALTDLGDLVVSGSVELLALLSGSRCPGGSLVLGGPVGATSMPTVREFSLDDRGAAHVELPEGGNWLVWARCPDGRRDVEPNVLPNIEDLAGSEVRLTLRDRESSPPESRP